MKEIDIKGIEKKDKTVKHPADIGINEHNLFTFPEMPGKERAGAEMVLQFSQDGRKCELHRKEKLGL